jgi:hypothetical protein
MGAVEKFQYLGSPASILVTIPNELSQLETIEVIASKRLRWTRYVLWRIDPLLGRDLEAGSETAAVA